MSMKEMSNLGTYLTPRGQLFATQVLMLHGALFNASLFGLERTIVWLSSAHAAFEMRLCLWGRFFAVELNSSNLWSRNYFKIYWFDKIYSVLLEVLNRWNMKFIFRKSSYGIVLLIFNALSN